MPEIDLSPDLKRRFARTRLVVLPEDYYMVRLPPDAKAIPPEWYRPATTRFAMFMRESDALTLVVGRRKWLRLQNLFDEYQESEPMKVITFDLKLPMEVYGYIAAISRLLAAERISILPISSFHRDHVLVRKGDLPRAMRVLRKFLEACKNSR